jgi:Transposase DDE domain
MTEPLHRALAAQECLPETHVVDGGYVDADALVSSRATHAIELLGPIPLENSWQAKAAQGFDLSHFHIHWEQQTVKCPTGKQSRSCSLGKDRFEQDAIYVRFDPADCRMCPCRADCTHAKAGSRSLTFRPQQLYLALQAARARQITDEFRQQYAVRAGIEGTLSQALRVSDLRQARYRGLPKTHLQHLLTATALNVLRLAAWLLEPSLRGTQISRFAALALAHKEPAAWGNGWIRWSAPQRTIPHDLTDDTLVWNQLSLRAKSVRMEKGYGQTKTSSWEFKLQMVHLLAKGTHNMSQISRDYHVTRSLLYAWLRL